MRTPLVAGNWKMNLLRADALELARSIAEALSAEPLSHPVEVVLCPPAVYLDPLRAAVAGSPLRLGAQNVFHESAGAFTGEVSAGMLADLGVGYVIIGHSERRHTIGHLEDDRLFNLKLRAAQAAGLRPILCVGETLAERTAGRTLDVLTFQLTAGLIGAVLQRPDELVIAYEPVWAIGTGKTATPAQAQEAHAHLRQELSRLSGAASGQIRILYGGSVTAENAAELFAQPDVDGGLIGGASLKAAAFVTIIRAAARR